LLLAGTIPAVGEVVSRLRSELSFEARFIYAEGFGGFVGSPEDAGRFNKLESFGGCQNVGLTLK
jgi:hypothetical protein